MQWMNLKNWGIRMKVLLYGYGLMGKKVAHQLREKDEFDLIGVVSYEFDEKAPDILHHTHRYSFLYCGSVRFHLAYLPEPRLSPQ